MKALPAYTALGAALAVALFPATAAAKSTATYLYPLEEVWPTAVRFLRIDRGYTVKERDAEAGYILFELLENERLYRGAFELVKTESEGRPATRVVVSITDLPRHFEIVLTDKLGSKLKEDYGSPPAPARRESPASKPPPDGGPAR